MANTGRKYEDFVASLQQALLSAEKITAQNNIVLEVDKKIVDNCGVERQFDIYWEYELGGLVYKTVIECKDYKSKISVEKIDAFIGKIRDIPGLKPVFATKTGYQSGAKKKAEQNKVDLLLVREQNDSDWTDEDGTPLVKKVRINMHVKIPAHIHKFEPSIDSEWVRNNTDHDIEKPICFSGFEDEIFIEDEGSGDTYSLHQLASRLMPLDGKEYGTFEKVEGFDDAFISYNGFRFKLSGYKVEYSIPQPINAPMEIDFSKELIGVIEYLQKGTKKTIFRDGVVR